MKEEKSLYEKMEEAFRLSCRVDPARRFSERDETMIAAWQDGLMHKYALARITGRCSLGDMIDFDPAKFEKEVDRDIERLKKLSQRA